jgi:hypothetical protein
VYWKEILAMSLTILSPVAEAWGQAMTERATTTALPSAASALRISLLSNSKANVNHLFAGLRRQLESRGVGDVTLHDKGSPAIPVPDSMRDAIVSGSDLFITAMADWGACTSWSVHDAVAVEAAGVPSIVVTTEKFIKLGKLEAAALGLDDLHFELIPHPLCGLEPDVANERGLHLGDAVIRYLNERGAEDS